MTEIAVPTSPHSVRRSPETTEVGETQVAVSGRLIADGFASRSQAEARATLVLRPMVDPPNFPPDGIKVNLRRWPTEAMAGYFPPDDGRPHGSIVRICILPAGGLTGRDDGTRIAELRAMLAARGMPIEMNASLSWHVDGDIAGRVEDFWRSVMSPPEDGHRSIWDAMSKALACTYDDATSVVIPRPHQAAALAFTFERARMVLDAIAGPQSPLITRPPMQEEFALDRPWYRGDQKIRLASLDADAFVLGDGGSPRDEEFWIAPYRARTADLLAGKTPEPIWPSAETFAAAALGDGSAALRIRERVFAAHHATSPTNPVHPVCTTEEMDLNTARRRLGALISLPSLQRLFGFAADVYFDRKVLSDNIRMLQQAVGTTAPFVIIAPAAKGATWTLARFEPATAKRPATFCPASWSELTTDRPKSKFGLRNLENDGYDIVTVEPVLATEANINHAARGESVGSALSPAEAGVPVLHNGGLRVVRVADEPRLPAASVCAPSDSVQSADDLKVGDRLMVGIRTGDKVLWRSPDYRAIEFIDPDDKAPKGWVENELKRRIGPDVTRRVQLDGGMAMSAEQRLIDDTFEPETERDPVGKKALKIIADGTVALWGSDPGGVPQAVDRDGKYVSEHSVSVIEELDVTRIFSAPHRRLHAADVLSPTLRFGWPYHVALPTVFEGGGCADPDGTADATDRDPALALPHLGGNGRRFLRHERVNAPMVVILESDYPKLNGLKPPQRGPDMYVRTFADRGSDPVLSRRLILPPPVPLQFAMLHDVLRSIQTKRGVPVPGLKGMALLGRNDDRKPSRVRVGEGLDGEHHGPLYYPDPAASVLMLGLKLPSEKDASSSAFVEKPIAVALGARTWPDRDSHAAKRVWPDVLPVLLEVKAVEKLAGRPRMSEPTVGWLGPGEKLFDRKTSGSVEVRVVQILMGRGEDLLLQAWCVPTVNQLADWFDAVEAAGVLATNEGPAHGDPDSACFIGLKNLLAKEFPMPKSEGAAATACVGAGAMRAPSRRGLSVLAGLVYRELLLRPIPALASPLPMRLTHAIDDALLPVPKLDAHLAVTRRLFEGKLPRDKEKTAKTSESGDDRAQESPADFVNEVQISDWGPASTQQGATVTLIGGDVEFDPASTSGLVIEAYCAAPFGEPLDPETGRPPTQRLANNWAGVHPEQIGTFGFLVDKDRNVDFRRKTVVALSFDGLPQPKDGRAGRQTYSLQALMAAAWGEQRIFGDALRAALPAAFQSSGARQLWLRAVPVNRHSGFFPSVKEKGGGRKTRPDPPSWTPGHEPPHLWLPSTARPAPPVIDHVSVALTLRKMRTRIGMDGTFTVGVEQVNSLIIWHGRPFFSSGEGEMLALVCWPPGLFTQGILRDGKGKEWFTVDAGSKEGPEFFDEDLGPGGSYVTRWAADPLVGDDVPSANFPTGPLIDPERLPEDGLRVTRAFMPIPVAGNDWATDAVPEVKAAKPADAKSAVDAMGVAPPNAFLAVALQAYVPKFDPVQELWYISIAMKTDPLPFPRMRLGLVRYQPHAREDDLPPEGSEPVRLRVSTPTTEWVKPLPGRKATVTCRPRSDGSTEIYVTIDGPAATPSKSGDVEQDMLVEVIRYRRDEVSAQEEVAMDADRVPATCGEWSRDPLDGTARGWSRKLQGGRTWTCMFVLKEPLTFDGWSHAVTVKETRKMPKASAHAIGVTGPNFLARIELEAGA